MDLSQAPTPALVLDRGKLSANCERMLGRARRLGVPLRTHMKTLKSIDAARLAIDPAHGGVAAATLKEAEYFAAHGIADIQYAVCITPDKLPRAAAILDRAPRFSVFLDSLETAAAMADYASATGAPLRAWIEIDSGEHRTGVLPESDVLLQIGRTLAASPVILEGVATHGGHSYAARTPEQMAAVAVEERVAVVRAAARLRAAGIGCPGVSAGSTPTAMHAASGEGLTELRAGVYMAGDLFQAGVGSQTRDDVAVTVLATVISHKRERNQIVVDAGGLALSKDRATAALAGGDLGYGLVLDLHGRAALGELTIAGVHQEHGEITAAEPLPFDRLPIGARVRIAPNHVCMTAAMYDRYHVVDGGTEVLDGWDRTNGW